MDDKLKFILAGLAVMLGGNLGSILNAYNPQVRALPFTALDGALLQTRIEYLEFQQKENTRSLRSRDNRRWNLPDQIEWIDSTEQINEGWRGATPKVTK